MRNVRRESGRGVVVAVETGEVEEGAPGTTGEGRAGRGRSPKPDTIYRVNVMSEAG